MAMLQFSLQRHIKIFIILVLFHAVVTHVVFFLLRGNDSCKAFLNEKTPPCSFHNYNFEEAQACLRPRPPSKLSTYIFIGDTHMLYLYKSILVVLGCYSDDVIISKNMDTTHICGENIKVNFYWREAGVANFTSLMQSFEEKSIPADLIILNGVLHTIIWYGGSEMKLQQYRKELALVSPKLDRIARSTTVLWYVQPPIQEMEVGMKWPAYKNLTNKAIEKYNKAVIDILAQTHIHIWHTARFRAEDRIHLYRDVVHLGDTTENLYAQHILNYLCNKKFKFQDGTCCNTEKSFANYLPEDIYFFLYFGLLSMIPIAHILVSCIYRPWMEKLESKSFKIKFYLSRTHITFLIIFLLVIYLLIYFIVRTPMISKDPQGMLRFRAGHIVVFLVILECSFHGTEHKSYNVLEKLMKETSGFLIGVLLLKDWYQISDPALYDEFFSCIQSLLMVVEGINFYRKFVVENSLMHLAIAFLRITFMIATMSQILLQSPQPFPFVHLLLNMAIGGIALVLGLAFFSLTKSSPLLPKAIVIAFMFSFNYAIYEHRAQIFNFEILLNVFKTRERSYEEWISSYQKSAFSISQGTLQGMVLVFFERSFFTPTHKETFKERLIYMFFFGSQVFGVSIFLSQPDLITQIPNHAFTCNIMFTMYLLLRTSLLQVKEIYCGGLVWIGSFWIELYLLYRDVAMPFDGTSFLSLFPFDRDINTIMVLIFVLALANLLKESLDGIFRKIAHLNSTIK